MLFFLVVLCVVGTAMSHVAVGAFNICKFNSKSFPFVQELVGALIVGC